MKNGIYNSVGGIVRLAVALALVPLLIRIIGPSDFGVWSLAFAIVGISAVTETGLSSSVTVFASRDLAQRDHKALSETLTLSLTASIIVAAIVAITLWCGADRIVAWFPKIPEKDRVFVSKSLQIGAILVLARLPQQVLIGLQQAFQRFGILNAILTAQSITLGIAMVVVAFSGGRTVQFMIIQTAVAVAALLGHAVATIRLLHQEHLRFNWNAQKTRHMLRFGVLNTTANIGGVLFTQCDRLIVGAFLDTATLGVYAAITAISSQINVISSLPVQPLLARVSQFWTNKDDPAAARQDIQHALQLNSLLAFGLATAIFVFAPAISQIVFHNAANETIVLALRGTCLIYAAYSLNATGYFVLPAVGEVALHTIVQVCGGVLSLLLIWIGATNWGLLGAVCGNIGFISTLVLTVFAARKLGIRQLDLAGWLAFPVVWMVATVAVAIILPSSLAFQCCLFVISCVVLFRWAVRLIPAALVPRWMKPSSEPTSK